MGQCGSRNTGASCCWNRLLLLLYAALLVSFGGVASQDCPLNATQNLPLLIQNRDNFDTAKVGRLYLSAYPCTGSGLITSISVVYRTSRRFRSLRELQFALYSKKEAYDFERISSVVTLPSETRPAVELGGSVSVVTISLAPEDQIPVLEGNVVGIQMNAPNSQEESGMAWLLGASSSSRHTAEFSIEDLLVDTGDLEQTAGFPGATFYVEPVNVTTVMTDDPTVFLPEPTSTTPNTTDNDDPDPDQRSSPIPVPVYIAVVVVIFLILMGVVAAVIFWIVRKKRKLSKGVKTSAASSVAPALDRTLVDAIGANSTPSVVVVPNKPRRTRPGEPVMVGGGPNGPPPITITSSSGSGGGGGGGTGNDDDSGDTDSQPYDSCYMFTYMDSDELDHSGEYPRDPTPYEVPLARQGLRSSKRSMHFVHLDTHPTVAMRTGRAIYDHLNPFQPPPGDVKGLRNTLAQRKCAEIPRSALRRGHLIGKGEFGDVFKGFWDSPSLMVQPVALKMLRGNANKQDRVKFLQEAAIMGQFNHPHIVKLFGALTAGEPMTLVLELLEQGDLLQWLESHSSKNELDLMDMPKQLMFYCQDIADGMKYLCNKGFIHRDLAARNILLDLNLRCKIADFGLARDLYGSAYYASSAAKVPVRWSPPEVLSDRRYSPQSDVWSYAMVMFEIWSLGQMPFADISTLRNVIKTVVKKKGYLQPPPPGCPRAMYKIMVQCWNFNDSDRISFNDISILLSAPKDSLLDVPQSDLDVCRQPLKAGSLGSHLATSNDLYQDLQNYYSASPDSNNCV